MNASEYANGLRNAADFIEAHPELPCPSPGRVDVYGCTKEQMADVARAAHKVSKHFGQEIVWISVEVSPAVTVDYNAKREEVCERVQVGTKVEPEHIIPAQPEQIVAAKEIPVYEWRCGSILKPGSEMQEVANA